MGAERMDEPVVLAGVHVGYPPDWSFGWDVPESNRYSFQGLGSKRPPLTNAPTRPPSLTQRVIVPSGEQNVSCLVRTFQRFNRPFSLMSNSSLDEKVTASPSPAALSSLAWSTFQTRAPLIARRAPSGLKSRRCPIP